MRMAYVCGKAQDVFREIAPALEIIAHGSLHGKNAVAEFRGFDKLAHLCIIQQLRKRSADMTIPGGAVLDGR